jgi:hypothetical protein
MATLPTCVLSRRGLSLLQHAPRSSPYDTGAGSRASYKLAQGRQGQTAAHGARNCPAVTSTPPLSPRPAGERVGRHAGGVQPHPGGHTLSTSTHPAWGPRPTRHVTGAPVTTCKKLHRHSRQYRAFSTAEPVPRLEATLRMTRQCQPSTSVTGRSAAGEGATVDTARNGPTVMAVAGGRKRQSSRQQAQPPPGIAKGPSPTAEDDASVFRSSNGSCTRNGRPVNHSSRRINSAAGQAAPLAGEAGDASPPP